MVDGNLGAAISRAQKMVNDAFKEHEKHVTKIIVQNHYLLEDSARLYEENANLRELVRDMLNAWDDVQRETVTGPTFDECEARAYKMGIEL